MKILDRDVAAAQVIEYLASPAGRKWSRRRIRDRLERQRDNSGVFADVIPEETGDPFKAARWPEPFHHWDLGNDGPF